MATPNTVVKYTLRAGSPLPMAVGTGCGTATAPTTYVLQTFGVDEIEVDSYDSLIGLHGSEVMQGRQNYPEISSTGRPDSGILATFNTSSFTRVSYTGTNNRNTDGDQIFNGSEEHSPNWVDESVIVWIT